MRADCMPHGCPNRHHGVEQRLPLTPQANCLRRAPDSVPENNVVQHFHMNRRSSHIADAELAILEVLWAEGPATIRQIAERLYPQGAVSEYATVQKLLARLEAKQCVGRDRSGFAHVFRAAIERRDVIDRRLAEVAAKLCGGSLTPLLMHLVEATRLSPADRQELRDMLDEAPEENISQRGKSR